MRDEDVETVAETVLRDFLKYDGEVPEGVTVEHLSGWLRKFFILGKSSTSNGLRSDVRTDA